MTKQEFRELTSSLLLLDGATGSNLMKAGMPSGVCTEVWILEHRDVITDLQRAYAEAGSQIIYAPTFGANPINLARHGLEDKLTEFTHKLVEYTRSAVKGSAYIAGDMTTTGEMLEPFGDLTYEEAREAYIKQITCLVEAKVDLLVVETMISIQETFAALDAAQSVCDLPVMCSLTVEADGSLFTGGNVIDAARDLEEAGACAVGINCSVGPDQMESVVRGIKQKVTIPVLAKPNAGMPDIDSQGKAVYHMPPEAFAEHMQKLVDSGATIIGGCCGTTPAYIKALAGLHL